MSGQNPVSGALAPSARVGTRLISLVIGARWRLLAVMLILSVGATPKAVGNGSGGVAGYVGIAPKEPAIYTYTIALLFIIVASVVDRRRGDWQGLRLWIPLLAWLVALSAFVWPFSLRMTSGLLHLGVGALIFAAGALLARRNPGSSVVAWTFAAVVWIQLLAIVSAEFGLPLRRVAGPQAPDLIGRAYALTGHPGELAKVLIFCTMFALLLPRRTVEERLLGRLTLGAALVGISFSQSRTGLVGVIALIVAYTVLEAVAAGLRRTHLFVLGAGVVLSLASLPWLIARFSADPAGGSRQHLLSVAFSLIKDNPWAGLGPNNYVALGGAIDKLTASGVPVHNAFLLPAAELGVIGGLLLWLPFGAVLVMAVRAAKATKLRDQPSRVVLSAAPVILLTALTGWGLLQSPVFPMMALVFGYLSQQIRAGKTVLRTDTESHGSYAA